jgi:erythrin-vacuolar iron transport family protein
MPREIDFAALSLRDALDLAILIEDEAQERYEELAEQMEAYHTPEAARFFRFMSANEAKHGQELRSRRQARFGGTPAAIDRDMIWDVEAPGYEEARAFMSARQALEVALQAEIKAHDYFQHVLPYLKDPEVKQLFDELREEEVEHQKLVQQQLDRQPPDDGLDPEEFVDEPQGM